MSTLLVVLRSSGKSSSVNHPAVIRYICVYIVNNCIPKLSRNFPQFFVGFFRDVWTRSGGSANFRRWTHLRSRERGVQIHLRNIPRPLPPPLPGGPKGSSVRLYQVRFSGCETESEFTVFFHCFWYSGFHLPKTVWSKARPKYLRTQ